jgi:manganese/zinc/iron transport system permease protein
MIFWRTLLKNFRLNRGKSSMTSGILFCLAILVAGIATAESVKTANAEAAQTQTSQVLRVFSMRDYNTRVVVAGATLLGAASGLVGSFALLRRRALLGDAVSHATLPGIGLAWLIGLYFGFTAKSLPLLLAGATVTGVLGTLMILAIRHTTRLREDAALGVVLGVFFGAGIVVLGVIQRIPSASSAGLETFIYGKTASLLWSDTLVIGICSVLLLGAVFFFYRELQLLCFDDAFCGSQGYPVLLLDIGLMTMIVLVTIVGLQAVGLILMIALLVIPPAAARFWTRDMIAMMKIAAALGGLSAMLGAMLSAIWPGLPSGAVIVLVAASMFLLSMLIGPSDGIVFRILARWSLEKKIDQQHLLRALYELCEQHDDGNKTDRSETVVPPSPFHASFSIEQLFHNRSWSISELRRIVRMAQRAGNVLVKPDGQIRLTETGASMAARVVREHRLWEMYLITYAEVAPGRVDRGADAIEHVLDPAVISRLEQLLGTRLPIQGNLASPHPLDPLVITDGGNG